MTKAGDRVSYEFKRKDGPPRTITGTVVEVIAGAVIMDVNTGEKFPGFKFVIKDENGKLHTTMAMKETTP